MTLILTLTLILALTLALTLTLTLILTLSLGLREDGAMGLEVQHRTRKRYEPLLASGSLATFPEQPSLGNHPWATNSLAAFPEQSSLSNSLARLASFL